jgi:hypothetical protein
VPFAAARREAISAPSRIVGTWRPALHRTNKTKQTMKHLTSLLTTLGFLCAINSPHAADQARSSPLEAKDGFRPLFNGKDLSGWKLRNPQGHPSWSVKEGELVNTVKPGEHGTDLVTDQKFWNFTVRYEYKTPPRANSGFYLRGRHEIQILDDFEQGKPAINGNGSIYNFKAPDKFASKPPGDWNTVEATIIGNKISVTMNGVKIHENVECDKATGSQIDDRVNEPGPIFLQGDHGSVTFRNLRIKELK